MSFRILSKYVVKRKIERGTDGIVYQAKRNDNGGKVAIKICKRKQDGFPVEIANNLILRQSRIDGVAKMIDYEVISDKYMIVMEHMPCDLFTYSSIKPLTENDCRNIASQLVKILSDMQNKAGLSHMDIKVENTLIDPSTGKIKLCDFSACAFVETLVADSTNKGTEAYWAPEIVKSRRFYPTRSNIWAIGIMLYSILPGHVDVPWEQYQDGMVKELEFHRDVSKDAKNFVLTCLEPDVRVRVPLNYLVNMKWINEMYKC